MAGQMSEVPRLYEKLWREATAAFERGGPRLDPFLKNRAGDRRRGVTLIARPDSRVRERVADFLREIAKVAPRQYFYRPGELHLTVLSMIPVSDSWQESMPRLPEYLAVLDTVLRNRSAFSIAFRGVTASPEAVMVQGFPEGETLQQLRDDLRAALPGRDLGDRLDRRYKVTAAHLTVARFSTPMPDWKPLKALLAAHRETDFGESRIRALELIESDWYASADTVRALREYALW